jgi:hypothetical protein
MHAASKSSPLLLFIALAVAIAAICANCLSWSLVACSQEVSVEKEVAWGIDDEIVITVHFRNEQEMSRFVRSYGWTSRIIDPDKLGHTLDNPESEIQAARRLIREFIQSPAVKLVRR